MRDPKERLQDILDAIARIERYTSRGPETFNRDELVQVWVLHHIQIIGEAAARLGQEFHAAHPEIPWREIIAMRNVVVHEYFGIDPEEIWSTVERDLPRFKRAIENLLLKLEMGGT